MGATVSIRSSGDNMLSGLSKIGSKLRNSAFVRNVLIVMSGTAAAQAIGFALSPVISRLFTPADFGVFGSFTAVTGVIAAAITLEYSQAIMLPKERDDALNLFFVSGLSTVIISLLCAIACVVAPSYLMGLMKAPSAWVLVLLVTALLITGFNIALQTWCVRAKAFRHTSTSQVARSLSSNGMQIGLGFVGAGSLALVASTILGDLIASLNLLRVFLNDLRASTCKISWRRMRHLAKEYRDFPMYSASGEVVNALSMGLPVLLLSNYFGIAVAGAYAFGLRILSAPLGLITRALRQVLFQKATETDHSGGSLLVLYVKITSGLFAVALIPSTVLIVWAPPIFSWVFGSKWFIAGEFARGLILWQALMFCNLPSVLFGRILRLQRRLFILGIITLASRTTALIIGGICMTAHGTIWLFSVVGAVNNIIYIVIVGYVLMKKEGAGTWADMTNFAGEG